MQGYSKANLVPDFACLVACLLLASCVSVPTGTAHLYRKEVMAQVEPPKTQQTQQTQKSGEFAKFLFTNALDPKLTIRKSGTDKTGADVFAIYLSDAYFKYLKDIGGVNEVVVVAQFTETNAGNESDTVTRILGPYFSVSDKAGAPFLNKLLYGPKTLDSDHLNMKLTVLEYDQGENENSAAFLDFIQSVTQTLSLANPITLSEKTFAKEIAKNLLSLNKDDVVMQIDIDFTGNAGELQSIANNGSYLPLQVGDYVLINQEHCVPANCFMQMTDEGKSLNPFAWIGDIVMLVPTAIRRGWTDTPDKAALEDIDVNALQHGDHRVVWTNENSDSPNTTALKPFTDKTWLALSIVKGGDASLWQRRKLLSQAEAAMQNLIKTRGEPIEFSQSYRATQQALEDARVIETLSFVSPISSEGLFTPTTTDGEYCMYHPRNITDVVASFYRLDANDVPQQLPTADITKNAAKVTPNNACFTVSSAARTVGTYDMIATYKVGKDVLTQKVRYKIEK